MSKKEEYPEEIQKHINEVLMPKCKRISEDHMKELMEGFASPDYGFEGLAHLVDKGG